MFQRSTNAIYVPFPLSLAWDTATHPVLKSQINWSVKGQHVANVGYFNSAKLSIKKKLNKKEKDEKSK